MLSLGGLLECEPPNEHLYGFVGTLTLASQPQLVVSFKMIPLKFYMHILCVCCIYVTFNVTHVFTFCILFVFIVCIISALFIYVTGCLPSVGHLIYLMALR